MKEQSLFFKFKIANMILVMVIIYLAFTLTRGNYNFLQFFYLKKQYEKLSVNYKDLKLKRENYENKVSSLYGKDIDLDLVEEHLRNTMMYIKPNEVVIDID